MKLLITGDLVINQPYVVENISNELNDLFKQSDISIVNLEAPITNSVSKILKTGPHLKSNKESTLQVLKNLGVDMVTLANNHVLDYDEQGVQDTLDFCSENNIQTVGAGKNLEEAAKILFINTSEGKIAIINFAEKEWASATDKNPGANPMDLINNANQIKKAKDNADFVFVIVHGGHEYYNLPSPRMQKQYRFYVEQGADIVIGHHTHCISGNEIYKGVPIYYSLGNFLFTDSSTYEDWYLGLVLEVNINPTGSLSTLLHPVKQKKKSFELGMLKGEEKAQVLERINAYNIIINNKEKLKQNWEGYINVQTQAYLNLWAPTSYFKNKYIKAILNKLKLTKFLTSTSGLALHLNLIRCEAHSDLSKEILTKKLKEK